MRKNCLLFTDVHGCYDQLIQVLNKAGIRIKDNKIVKSPYYKIINMGDYLDKGPKIEEVVNFLYNNQEHITNINGNHEHFVVQYFRGKIKEKNDEILKFFDSVYRIKNKETINKIYHLYDNGLPFVEGENFIATHSPCQNKYLAKIDSISTKMQRNYRHTQHEDSLDLVETILGFYSSNIFTKKHIFGHIPFNKVWETNKFIALDTGCSQGGKLTAIDMETRELFESKGINASDRPLFEPKRSKKEVNLNKLDNREKRTVYNFCDNKVNFISGTVCPADKLDGELESLDWALNFYQGKTDSIVLQPKYMGSRFQVYLFPEIEKCYGITRNGYRPNVEGLEPEFERLIERFKDDFDAGLKLRILDTELLPWRVLGDDLIDRSFYGYSYLLSAKKKVEDYYNFASVIEKVVDSIPSDTGEMKKKDFIEKYGYHNWQKKVLAPELRTTPDTTEFLNQVSLYGSDGEIEIKPFNILKDVYSNKEINRVFESNCDKWQLINDDYSIYIEFVDGQLPQAFRDTAHEYYNKLTTKQGYEGIVVKPDVSTEDLVPYIKVRNPDYLQLVYGPDYQEGRKYDKLINKKRISNKLKKSLEDFKSGLKLLECPYDKVEKDNENYLKTLCRFIVSERQNERIDPRL